MHVLQSELVTTILGVDGSGPACGWESVVAGGSSSSSLSPILNNSSLVSQTSPIREDLGIGFVGEFWVILSV